ncbi:MAG: winged helix DNA-binding domain-containing protein [Dysgonomonas sp.]|nr:winged helix DNA-binding domain-containing protein [Dysgonomonas sp.]
MIPTTRLLSQQLVNPSFNNPKDLVSWMGAVQAQDYKMVKWALGLRLGSATIKDVEDSLHSGEIIRTHIMRPTWHLVPAEDLRWMMLLTGKRIKAAHRSYGYHRFIDDELCNKGNDHIVKILEGNNHLTKQEIGEELIKAGIAADPAHIAHFIMSAEVDGLICSGADKKNKVTYALLDERIPPTKELHKEEALTKIALRYFKSHSPASLNDFVWWSGLLITEAREAIKLIESELIKDKFSNDNLFVHQSYKECKEHEDTLHFLPSYDEYIISYKDRTAVLPLEHQPKAFTNYGIFYPIIMHKGKIVGNWKKATKKGGPIIETTFFDKKIKIDKALIKKAEEKYRAFYIL